MLERGSSTLANLLRPQLGASTQARQMGLRLFEVSFHYLGPYALLPRFQIGAYALTEQSAGTPGKPRAAQPSAGNSRAESGGKKDNIMSRASRTRDELTELIMREIRKHPECRDIQGATVIPSSQSLYGSNWDIALVGAAELTGRVGNTKKVVDDVVRRLQEQFDCSDC
jgi:hypothetical protein